MRIVTLNVNGIRSAGAQGPRALARAHRALGRRLPAGDQGAARRRAEGAARAAPLARLLPRRREEGLHRRRAVRQASAAGRHRLRQRRNSTPRAATSKPHFGKLTVISVYLPSGSSGPAPPGVQVPLSRRIPAAPRRRCARAKREIILCGDWNIAHQPIDLKNWRSNQKNSGFLPEERAWLTRVFDELGFVDVFRRINTEPDQYTWWSNRGQAWAKNVGWRIDYQIATPGIAAKARAACDLHEPALLRSRAADHRLRLRAAA